jgi:hypothetical protein
MKAYIYLFIISTFIITSACDDHLGDKETQYIIDQLTETSAIDSVYYFPNDSVVVNVGYFYFQWCDQKEARSGEACPAYFIVNQDTTTFKYQPIYHDKNIYQITFLGLEPYGDQNPLSIYPGTWYIDFAGNKTVIYSKGKTPLIRPRRIVLTRE